MSEIVWNIPSEKDWDMLEELSEKMENFPDSPFFNVGSTCQSKSSANYTLTNNSTQNLKEVFCHE